MRGRPALAAVVPCYNEAPLLAEAYRAIRSALRRVAGEDYRLLFVDDGSTDGSWEVLRGLAAVDSRVQLIRLSRNFGKEAALSAGINHCDAELALLLDADLQDPPELVGEMLRLRESEGANIVYGVRRSRGKESLVRRGGARGYYALHRLLSDDRMPADTADFKLIDRAVMDAFRLFGERNKYTRGILFWSGFRQRPFYYDRRPRVAGRSRYTGGRLFSLAGTGLLYFTRKPLHIIALFGVLCVLVGLLLLGWMLFSVLSPRIEPASGWASLITAVVFFSGVQLLTLGIIGGYIGHIFDEVKGRPEYIVAQTLNMP